MILVAHYLYLSSVDCSTYPEVYHQIVPVEAISGNRACHFDASHWQSFAGFQVVEQRPHLVKSAVAWWSGFEVNRPWTDHAMSKDARRPTNTPAGRV
jgi:hypothetical protein